MAVLWNTQLCSTNSKDKIRFMWKKFKSQNSECTFLSLRLVCFPGDGKKGKLSLKPDRSKIFVYLQITSALLVTFQQNFISPEWMS